MKIKEFQIQCVGYSIAADLYESSKDRVLLVLPGWTSSKKRHEQLTSHIVEKTNSSAVAIDYTGHGRSPFNYLDMRPAQHFLEVITAFDWIKENYPNASISVQGGSYGGYLATQLTKYREFDNLILRVPAIYTPNDFYSLNRDIERQTEKIYREDKEFLNSHPLLARASKFKGRTLVVVHENDEFIPKETTDKYIEVFNADSYLAKGWTHSYNFEAPEEEQLEYDNVFSDWLNKPHEI